MSLFDDVSLALNTVSSTVSSFKSFVDDKIDFATSTVDAVQNVVSDVNSLVGNAQSLITTLDPRNKIEFTRDLYDKAVSLAEVESLSLEYTEDTSKNKYGLFKGGNVYKSFKGDLDTSKSNVQPYYGWLTVDKSSTEYCLFSNGSESFIIALKDFEPKPIVKDFTPLYIKLQEENRGNSYHYNDLVTPGSLATTSKDKVSEAIVNDSYNEDISEENKNYYIKYNERFKEYKSQRDNVLLSVTAAATNIGNIAFENGFARTQAVVYTLPYTYNTNSDNSIPGVDSSDQILLCYQQPDQISYSQSASYESVSPRGTQQPFQFYTSANSVELSFTLKYHYDEIKGNRTDNKPGYDTLNYKSLQQIADIAESFTRPWQKSNGSIAPKIVRVILPGVAHIGYMTSAQISYKGDMMGEAFNYERNDDGNINSYIVNDAYSGETLLNKNGTSSYNTYFYNQLEISFNLIIIKDITLDVASEPPLDTNNKTTESVQENRVITEARQQSIEKNSSNMFDDPSGYMSVEEKNTAQANMSSMSEPTSSTSHGQTNSIITNIKNSVLNKAADLKTSFMNMFNK